MTREAERDRRQQRRITLRRIGQPQATNRQQGGQLAILLVIEDVSRFGGQPQRFRVDEILLRGTSEYTSGDRCYQRQRQRANEIERAPPQPHRGVGLLIGAALLLFGQRLHLRQLTRLALLLFTRLAIALGQAGGKVGLLRDVQRDIAAFGERRELSQPGSGY